MEMHAAILEFADLLDVASRSLSDIALADGTPPPALLQHIGELKEIALRLSDIGRQMHQLRR